LALSQKNSASLASTVSAMGSSSKAAAAGPPSPEKPAMPLPAKVVMMPFVTARMRWLPVSAM